MIRDYKIVIVSDNVENAERLKIILNFLGEPSFILDDNTKAELLTPDHILACVIILTENSNSFITKLIQSKEEVLTRVPVVLSTDIKSKAKSLEKIDKNIAANLPLDFSHAQILSALHQCQEVLENNTSIDNKGQNKPVTLFRSLVGTSNAIQEIRNLISKVADTDATVLILGESGSGKEVVARNLHYHSKRQGKPFVAINCGAIPQDLLESELFGHEKGAFTGAHSMRKGKFEAADGGTIFLDEIGDMPKAMQVKLLRVLQERTFEKVGGNKAIEIDVRIIAATHRNLIKEIEMDNFREDLFYRLNVFPITVPSLRERIIDLPDLINELLARVAGQNRETIKILDDAIEQMSLYSWPGNVRELANTIERLCIMYPGGILSVNELPAKIKEIGLSKVAHADA